MKQMVTQISRGIGAVFTLLAFLVSCSEPPRPPGEESPPSKPTSPTEGAAPKPVAKPPAEPTVQPLVVWIEAEPEEGKAPLKVQFTAMLKGGTPPVKLVWTFDDDSEPSSEANPVHTYTQPGSYTAEIAANDAGGDEDDDYLEILVE